MDLVPSARPRKLGELRGLSAEEIGEQTSRNFYTFFKLAETAESKVTAL